MDRRSGEILLRQSLDGHSTEFELIVAAYDGGSPPLSSSAIVRIKVVDKSMPVFVQQFYYAIIPESSEPLSPVLSVQASSPSGRQLIYSIVTGNEDEEFAVDFNTGMLSGFYPSDSHNLFQLELSRCCSYFVTLSLSAMLLVTFSSFLIIRKNYDC